MSALDQLPIPIQLLIGAITFALIFVIGQHVWLTLRMAISLRQATYGSQKIEDSDDSPRSIMIPPAFAQTARQLYDLGYVPFGAMRRTFTRLKAAAIFHILRQPDDLTTARFTPAAPPNLRVSIVTWFDDDSVIVTEYPHGRRLETDRLVNNFVRGSLAAAQAYHQQRVAEWTARGRTPVPLGDMVAYIRQQTYFMEHYNPLYGKQTRNRMIVMLVLTAVIAAGAIGLLVSIYQAVPLRSTVWFAVTGLAFLARVRLVTHYRWISTHPPGAVDDAPPDNKLEK